MDDEFFIGWEAKAPAALGGHLRRVAALLLLLGGGVAAVLATSHSKAADSSFEFGVERSFEGTLRHAPYPMLLVDRPGGGQSTWLVTVFGKRGAEAVTAALDGRRVKLVGSLVHRGGRTMIEVQPETIEDLGGSEVALAAVELGEATLCGEIVDSKCYLGVMKPGNLKTHRACAVRCISGGVPPVLLVREENEAPRYVLLAGTDGEPIGRALLEFVAEPVAITGSLSRAGGFETLRFDPASIRRERASRPGR